MDGRLEVGGRGKRRRVDVRLVHLNAQVKGNHTILNSTGRGRSPEAAQEAERRAHSFTHRVAEQTIGAGDRVKAESVSQERGAQCGSVAVRKGVAGRGDDAPVSTGAQDGRGAHLWVTVVVGDLRTALKEKFDELEVACETGRVQERRGEERVSVRHQHTLWLL
jgi:hypothetical protein